MRTTVHYKWALFPPEVGQTAFVLRVNPETSTMIDAMPYKTEVVTEVLSPTEFLTESCFYKKHVKG
jgi:hypothetical protein